MRALYHFRGAVACLVLALLAFLYASERQSAAYLRGALAVRDSVLKADSVKLATSLARVDTVHRVDSVRFAVAHTVYTHTTDTARVRDTLYVRKDVADFAVLTCSEALGSCERAKAVRDSIIANERARRETVERMLANVARDATARTVKWGAIGAAVGYGVCTLKK